MVLAAIHILILFSSSHRGLRYFLRNLASILGSLFLKLLFCFGLCFARVVNCFFFAIFFVLFIGPTWLINRYSKDSNSGNEVPSKDVPKTNGNPEGWVKMRICRTEEISEFYLDEDTDKTVVMGKRGEWEEREIVEVTKEEIERRVRTWLEVADE
jgi:hypothetical protein